MRVLAIETSCDETAAACYGDPDGRDPHLLSSVTLSQEKLHEKFHGIVPEVASRGHCAYILSIVHQAAEQAGLRLKQLDAIGVTLGPGLKGSLLIGVAAAKALAASFDRPLIAIDHLEAHAHSGYIAGTEPRFPALALVVSGGHSNFFRIEDVGVMTTLGETVDDAIGEAYDKVASLLGLPYPGGPHIDRLAEEYSTKQNAPLIDFPSPLLHSNDLNFSFSGLKSAVYRYWQQTQSKESADVAQIAASFQAAALKPLLHKLARATQETDDIQQVIVAGGVACNRALQKKLRKFEFADHVELCIPEPKYCTDNAAMCAYLTWHYAKRGRRDPLTVSPYSSAHASPVYGDVGGGRGR